jgi:glycosyltransferase involved in cell wall biosynthesis
MAMQLPVLISRQCNFDEVAGFGCGMIVEPDTAEIGGALSDMMSLSPTTLAGMGAKGKALVNARYQWSKIGEQIADVYDWLRGSARPSSVEIYD